MTPETLSSLRSRHPTLRYISCNIVPGDTSLTISYHFKLEPDLDFKPQVTIPSTGTLIDDTSSRLAFLLGMVELISYWKTACPEKIIVEAGTLSAYELTWWEHLYRHGLGEFFYLNSISPQLPFTISAASNEENISPDTGSRPLQGAIVLVGGGKDSIVTLECMKRFDIREARPLTALCVNPIPASIEAITIANYPAPLIIRRTIDPQLRTLNAAGYLNGHTPYSAFLAFVSILTAWQNGFEYVLASNETSASEGNAYIEGIEVNHQYSKSFEFESDFRAYLKSLNIPVSYFSTLRPFNELQICALFSGFSDYHTTFRSCNREQTTIARERTTEAASQPTPGEKRPGWCGTCPKCVFTFLCLTCFLDLNDAAAIFGKSPLSHATFLKTATELSGNSEHKPFECVGTYEEVQVALGVLQKKLAQNGDNSCEMIEALTPLIPAELPTLGGILKRWDSSHFLPADLAERLRHSLITATEGLKS